MKRTATNRYIAISLAIIFGGIMGLLFGHALPERMKKTVIQGIGLAVLQHLPGVKNKWARIFAGI